MFNLLQKWPHFSSLYVSMPFAMRFCSHQGVESVCPPLESGMDLGLALANTMWHAGSALGASRGLICFCLLSLVHLYLETKTRITSEGWETIWSCVLSIKAQPTPDILSHLPAKQSSRANLNKTSWEQTH